MDINKFDTIRSYNDSEIQEACQKLTNDQHFLHALSYMVGEKCLEHYKQEFTSFKTLTECQIFFLKIFADRIIKNSINNFTYSGLEKYATDEPCLLVSNHRDIILDSLLLQYALITHNLNPINTAIGDNLLFNNAAREFAKITRMFFVKRQGSNKERLMNTYILSDYIRNKIKKQKESVWIAQRNGRTKNGFDETLPGLLKMFSISKDGHIIDSLKDLNIHPVVISYEYESCDQLKARELYLSKNETYIKGPNEDLFSIQTGLFKEKGEVSLTVMDSINPFLDTINRQLRINEITMLVSQYIDKQIYKNYKLWKSNYIAYDMLDGNSRFKIRYSQGDKEDFLNYIDEQAVVENIPIAAMKENLLLIYANPVYAYLGEKMATHHEED